MDDLREGKYGVTLSPAQEIGLRFYDGVVDSRSLVSFTDVKLDINERMPRSEVEAIFKLIEPIGVSLLRSLSPSITTGSLFGLCSPHHR